MLYFISALFGNDVFRNGDIIYMAEVFVCLEEGFVSFLQVDSNTEQENTLLLHRVLIFS